MHKAIEAIQEILTHLEGLMGQILEDKDCSFHDKLEQAMDIIEKAAG